MMRRFRRIKQPKIYIPLIAALLVIIAVLMAVRNLNTPAQGVVTTQSSDSITNSPTTPDQKTYSDSHISFTYPGTYSLQSVDKTAPYIDIVNLVSTAFHNQYAAISIINESLAADSGASYRKTHTDLYKEVTAGAQTEVFSKNDHMEYTGYIQHGGEVVSISLTSVSATDLAKDYNQIAGSLDWGE